MRLIRRFEEAVQSLFLKGEVHGTTHLYNGEEASATGVGSTLGEGDKTWPAPTAATGTALAVGTSPQGLLDELLGRSTGVCGGRAGSMNVIDLEHGLIGCYGIVGGSISATLGASLALRGHGQRRRRVLRRRRDEPGLLPRVPELRARLQPARGLRLREQPLRRVHADGAGHRRHDPLARRGPRRRLRERRRHGRLGDARGGAARDRARPRRPRPGLPRDDDLPLRRPLAQRPGPLPQAGRARALEERDPLLVGRRRLVEDCGVAADAVDAIDAEIERR